MLLEESIALTQGWLKCYNPRLIMDPAELFRFLIAQSHKAPDAMAYKGSFQSSYL